jgi:hypothetical protein
MKERTNDVLIVGGSFGGVTELAEAGFRPVVPQSFQECAGLALGDNRALPAYSEFDLHRPDGKRFKYIRVRETEVR